jgi:hypothetical protein
MQTALLLSVLIVFAALLFGAAYLFVQFIIDRPLLGGGDAGGPHEAPAPESASAPIAGTAASLRKAVVLLAGNPREGIVTGRDDERKYHLGRLRPNPGGILGCSRLLLVGRSRSTPR